MSDKAFADAINQIAAQAEAEREQELRDEKRCQLMGKVRRAFVFVFLAGILASVYYYQAELQHFASEKLFSQPTAVQVDAKTREALKGIRAQAEQRDQVLNEITK
jgi:hypothetical protein